MKYQVNFYPTLVGVIKALALNRDSKLKFAKPQPKLGRRRQK